VRVGPGTTVDGMQNAGRSEEGKASTAHGIITGVVYVGTHPDRYLVAIRSLLEHTDMDIVVGCLYTQFLSTFAGLGPRVETCMVGSVSELCNLVYATRRTHLAVVNEPCLLPPEPFATAAEWLASDLRYATISFLSNAADFLSFPVRNLPQDRAPDGHDEQTITRRLRSLSPTADPAPVTYAAGPLVILSAPALAAVGEIVAPASARFDIAIADFSVRARAKGFVDLIDTSTYILRPSDLAVEPIDTTLTPDDRGWLLHRHQSLVSFLDAERFSGDSPFALAHQVARVKVQGLRILIDGSCFGPNQVGTQVATTHTIRALAENPDVAEVYVSLPGNVPSYAANVLSLPKVSARMAEGGDLRTFGAIDIAFRPYQPTPGWDVMKWKGAGVRFIISVLDTIAFHNGGYFASTGEWLSYRSFLQDCVRAADAATVISHDVAAQMMLHRFPIDPDRIVPIPLGTEHLRGDESGYMPDELGARGFVGGAFALCLGVNYSHKNRELALDAHAAVRAAGHDLSLIFAGPSVPHGTTRVLEARRGPREGVFVLPELSEPERNWLLRHASLVWYPTSAEGFGFVPFEAAAFGTPTVAVDFGPVRELAGRSFGDDVPVLATDWSVDALASAACRLLDDPDLSRRHVAALVAAGDRYSWKASGDALVRLFRHTLSQPKR
jgi:glycosyltransferase involved in cell wall biosynthesis